MLSVNNSFLRITFVHFLQSWSFTEWWGSWIARAINMQECLHNGMTCSTLHTPQIGHHLSFSFLNPEVGTEHIMMTGYTYKVLCVEYQQMVPTMAQSLGSLSHIARGLFWRGQYKDAVIQIKTLSTNFLNTSHIIIIIIYLFNLSSFTISEANYRLTLPLTYADPP